jgi:ribosomal protein L37AE/L43A
MPSQRRSSSRLRSSAAKKIQKHFRSRKRLRSKASRKIQSRFRGKQTRKVMKRVKATMQTDNNCSICFEPMIENVATALPCGHRFHKGCIQNWLSRSQGKCSLCRSVITNIPYVPEGRANRTFGNVPLSQQQQAPPAPPPILDPTQRRQYILQRLREIEMLQQRMAQLDDPREIPNITLNQALHIQHNARQLVTEIRRLFYEASENYQNYRNVRIDGNPVDQDVTNMYYITSDLLNRAQVLRNNATQIVDELGDDEPADLM